ncbi:MAG: envelope biogenesis factor ElyC [Deltaproteobacteria bacterium]|nr:envelope biogenesis factor ElyC [Deltaproteobacteria bacterium]
MFLIKKIVSVFLMPFTFSLLFLLIGLYYLWFTKNQKRGKYFVSAGFLSLIVFSFAPLINPLLSDLERNNTVYDGSKVEYVVVLGGGHNSDPTIPLSSHLISQSLMRLSEGISILRRNKGSKLVLSGFSGFQDKIPNAIVMEKVAVSLGVDNALIITEPKPRDTIEESMYISKIVKDKKFALVTSAFHMRRASAIFKKRGLNFVTAPTYYMVKRSGINLVPKPGTLSKSHTLISEWLGFIWAKIKGEA